MSPNTMNFFGMVLDTNIKMLGSLAHGEKSHGVNKNPRWFLSPNRTQNP